MCRQAFTESETPDWTRESWDIPRPGTTSYLTGMDDFDGADRFRILTESTGGVGRNFMIDSILGRRGAWGRALREHLRTRMNARPIEQVPHEGVDPINIEFIMEYAMVTRRRAEAYLRFFGDPVETVLCLAVPGEDPIPDFRERERPPLEMPYVSRYTRNRNATSAESREGYESA